MSEEEEENKDNPRLSAEEFKNRLAAAEFDMHKTAGRSMAGHHPNLNET
jgi:hypothetical protein